MNKKSFVFYLALFLLILTFSMSANYFDYDLWARLIAGMGVVDGGHVLTQDFLSYTPVHTWFDHEWGSGVIFYLFLKLNRVCRCRAAVRSADLSLYRATACSRQSAAWHCRVP